MHRRIPALSFFLLAAMAACSPTPAPAADGETAGQLGDDGSGGHGCSNALIRQQQAVCREACPAQGLGVSEGVKYCKTDDPSGQAGHVDAPCACAVPACGALDQPCCQTGCGQGLACQAGVCAAPADAPASAIDPTADYLVTITSVSVPASTRDGVSWDPFDGMPDPKVCVGNACTRTCADTYACNPTAPLRVSGASLLQSAMVTVLDEDVVDLDDVIATWSVTFTSVGVEQKLDDGAGTTVTYRIDDAP